jgi:hypothetical protein
MNYESAVKLTMHKLIEGGYLPCEALYLAVTKEPTLATTAVMCGVRQVWLRTHNITLPNGIRALAKTYSVMIEANL